MFLTEIKSKIGEDISILIRPDNHTWNYLCDCGDASGLTVKECQNIKGIFISHTHIDHFINFDQILRHQIEGRQRVVICGPLHIARQVHAKILGYSWNLIQEGAILYEIHEIVEEGLIKVYELEPPVWNLVEVGEIRGNTVYQNERFKVRYSLLDHKLPSVAYLFQENDTIKIELTGTGLKGGRWVQELKLAFENGDRAFPIQVENTLYMAEELFRLIYVNKGHTVGVIMDHAAHEENHGRITTLFSNCDQVFIECFYKDEDQEQAEKNFHSYASKSGEVMRRSLVKEAIPVHFSRRYTDEDIRQIQEEFERAFRG